MKTIKPFSSIIYDDPIHLSKILEPFVDCGLIDFYAFIQHCPEDDENKEHLHFYCECSNKVDLVEFRKNFNRLNDNNELVTTAMPLRVSRFGDWCLYALHDPRYLLSKGQSRKYKYDLHNIYTNNNDLLLEKYKTIDYSKIKTTTKNIIDDIIVGKSFIEIAVDNNIPLTSLRCLKDLMTIDFTFRNNYKNHNQGE